VDEKEYIFVKFQQFTEFLREQKGHVDTDAGGDDRNNPLPENALVFLMRELID